MSEFRDILSSMGYILTENAKEFRARPIYRESNNPMSLRVDKFTGNFFDFGTGQYGSFHDLVNLTLGLGSVSAAKDYLANKNIYVSPVEEKPKIRMPKTFSSDVLAEVQSEHAYWINRGISKEVIEQFGGGVHAQGKMAQRYVFPILNSKKEIVGLSGRDLTGKSRIKWKHLGDKSNWKYPLQVNIKEIQSAKEVILVESIGDCLSLFECGIKNVMVVFGIEVGVGVLNMLLRLSPNRIIIAFNNDEKDTFAGNRGANKAESKLLKYFDQNQLVKTKLAMKDFNEMLLTNKELIKEWYEGINV